MYSYGATEEEAINRMSEIINGSFKKIGLDDTFKTGCDKCGSCCINVAVPMNAFDIYQLGKYYKELGYNEDDTVKFMYQDLDIDDSSIFPGIELKSNGLCRFAKANIYGDFECKLGEKSPSTCKARYIAVATKMNIKYKKDRFDIDQFILDNRVDGSSNETSRFFLLDEQLSHCKCNKLEEVKVRDYISHRIKYQDEYSLALAMPIIIQSYLPFNSFMKLMSVSEKYLKNSLKESSKKYQVMIFHAYYFANPFSKKSFKEQAMENIEELETEILPAFNKLYNNVYSLFDLTNDNQLNDILSLGSMEESVEAFKKYFTENQDKVGMKSIELMKKIKSGDANYTKKSGE